MKRFQTLSRAGQLVSLSLRYLSSRHYSSKYTKANAPRRILTFITVVPVRNCCSDTQEVHEDAASCVRYKPRLYFLVTVSLLTEPCLRTFADTDARLHKKALLFDRKPSAEWQTLREARLEAVWRN